MLGRSSPRDGSTDGTLFSTLQATEQPPQPVHLSRSMAMPHLRWGPPEGPLTSAGDGALPWARPMASSPAPTPVPRAAAAVARAARRRGSAGSSVVASLVD